MINDQHLWRLAALLSLALLALGPLGAKAGASQICQNTGVGVATMDAFMANAMDCYDTDSNKVIDTEELKAVIKGFACNAECPPKKDIGRITLATDEVKAKILGFFNGTATGLLHRYSSHASNCNGTLFHMQTDQFPHILILALTASG